jgi:hypothetical protein
MHHPRGCPMGRPLGQLAVAVVALHTEDVGVEAQEEEPMLPPVLLQPLVLPPLLPQLLRLQLLRLLLALLPELSRRCTLQP